MTSVDIFVSQENTLGGRGANGIPVEYNAVGSAPAGANLGTITPPTGQNAVIGFNSAVFSTGYNVVLLDGPRANYAIQVNSSGGTTINDIGAGDATYGQSVTVGGESYILFNGAHIATSDTATVAALTTPPGDPRAVLNYPNDIYFVMNQGNAQIAQFYSAMLPWEPQPSLAGFEYWVKALNVGMPLWNIAQSFINTSYFQQTFGDPGTTHAQRLAYVELLYQHILGMNLDASNSGVQYWVNAMDTNPLMDGARTLISFTNATSNTSLINVASGATPGADTGYLINYSLTGGMADAGVQQSASTVLTQGIRSGYVDTSQIDTSTVANAIVVVGKDYVEGVGYGGSRMSVLFTTAANQTIVASVGVPGLCGGGQNDTLISAANGGSNLSLGGDRTGNGINEVALLHGSNNIVSVFSTGNTVIGYQLAGTDSLTLGNIGGGPNPHVITSASASAKVDGHVLQNLIATTTPTITSWTGNFIYVGAVADSSAGTMAAAANAVYTVADVQNEHVVFYGKLGNDTVMYNWEGVAFINSADTNSNHVVDASEFNASVTLIGVNASSITAAALATH